MSCCPARSWTLRRSAVLASSPLRPVRSPVRADGEPRLGRPAAGEPRPVGRASRAGIPGRAARACWPARPRRSGRPAAAARWILIAGGQCVFRSGQTLGVCIRVRAWPRLPPRLRIPARFSVSARLSVCRQLSVRARLCGAGPRVVPARLTVLAGNSLIRPAPPDPVAATRAGRMSVGKPQQPVSQGLPVARSAAAGRGLVDPRPVGCRSVGCRSVSCRPVRCAVDRRAVSRRTVRRRPVGRGGRAGQVGQPHEPIVPQPARFRRP